MQRPLWRPQLLDGKDDSVTGIRDRHYAITKTVFHRNTTSEVVWKKIHADVDKLQVVQLG
jgi:hypothetical protein